MRDILGQEKSLARVLERQTGAGEAEVREAISGNLCRCTGYQTIVEAALAALAEVRAEQT